MSLVAAAVVVIFAAADILMSLLLLLLLLSGARTVGISIRSGSRCIVQKRWWVSSSTGSLVIVIMVGSHIGSRNPNLPQKRHTRPMMMMMWFYNQCSPVRFMKTLARNQIEIQLLCKQLTSNLHNNLPSVDLNHLLLILLSILYVQVSTKTMLQVLAKSVLVVAFSTVQGLYWSI